MNRQNFIRNRRHNIKVRREVLDFSSAIEMLIYEMKPIGYLVFATAVLRTNFSNTLWIKFSAVGILLFAVYITINRLIHRGYL